MHKFHTVIFTYSKCLYFCSRHLAIYINYWKKRSLNLSFHLIIHHTTIVILLFYIWIIFLLLSSNFPTLEENPPTAREGKSVFVWQNTFCRTKTQLALFVWTENPLKVDCGYMPIFSYKIKSYLPDEKCKYQFVCDKSVCRVEYRVNGVPDI